MESQIFEGIVKWFGSKGEAFGYIHRFKHVDGTDGECFIHFKQISPENQENPKFRVLQKGQKVSFQIGPGFPSNKGTQAFNVKVLDGNSGKRNDGIEGTLSRDS